MKYTTSLSAGLILSLFLLGAGCTNPSTTTNDVQGTVSNTSDQAEVTDWYPTTKGPWDGVIQMATSTDGLNFQKGDVLFEQSGVPNLLRLNDGTLILTYQYFSSESEDLFDVIAYSVSNDEGETWSDTKPMTLVGLPMGLDSRKHPMDPTLVQLSDGRLRLYFTYHAQGNKTAALYAATAPDDQIDSTFQVETTPALMTSSNLLDPAVVYFDGVWHHYTWQDSGDDNYHSTSTDGASFTLQDNINLPMDFLGQVITTDAGLRFYGTGKGGVVSAVSTNGSDWTMESGQRIQGADPAVQRLADGSYLMVYTSINFN